MSSLPSPFDEGSLETYHWNRCVVAEDRTEYGTEEIRNNRLTLWFERWRVPIRRWVASHATLPAADLDDLVQEVFLRLLRYSDDALIEYPQTYLFRIASNVASEWRERTRRRPTHDETFLEELQDETDDEPENVIAHSLVSKRVQLAVDRLPQRQRDVLVLHIHENLTCPQIAGRLGLTRRMVRRDLANAYTQLRLDLDGDLRMSSVTQDRAVVP